MTSTPLVVLTAQADQNLSDGASEHLQLADVTAFIMRTISKAPAEADTTMAVTH